jgi:small conductance mechanosensitive channel
MDSLLLQLKEMTFDHALPLLARGCGALILGLLGRRLILAIQRRMHAELERRALAGARIHSLEALINGGLRGLLILATFRVLGVDTASLVALLATSGLVVGMAWSRLLSNAGAGVFLMVFQPFQVGDFISIGDVSGTVHEVGLFTTTLDTLDHQRLLIGNSRLCGDHSAMSRSAAPRSQVVVRVPLEYGTDVNSLVHQLQERMREVSGILDEPARQVGISEFLATGPVVHLTAWCSPRDMHMLERQLHAVAYEVLYTAGYVPPAQRLQRVG